MENACRETSPCEDRKNHQKQTSDFLINLGALKTIIHAGHQFHHQLGQF
jgi:hypothetical protein